MLVAVAERAAAPRGCRLSETATSFPSPPRLAHSSCRALSSFCGRASVDFDMGLWAFDSCLVQG